MLESTFQAKLIKDLEKAFPGCEILKNDSSYRQGIPDLTIFFGSRYALLEVKAERPTPGSDDFEPNQEWYLDKFSRLSFSACVYPANKRDVINDLRSYFRS